jgi:hypothetical protein
MAVIVSGTQRTKQAGSYEPAKPQRTSAIKVQIKHDCHSFSPSQIHKP